MKAASLLILTACLFPITSRAGSEANRICMEAKLETSTDEDSKVKVTYNRNIAIKSDEQVKELPTKIKQQLIIVAKAAIKAYKSGESKFQSAKDIKDTVDAVAFIREINENKDEEINVAYLTAENGDKFTKVTFYPGAQVGTIFVHDKLTAVAHVSDGDVMCVD